MRSSSSLLLLGFGFLTFSCGGSPTSGSGGSGAGGAGAGGSTTTSTGGATSTGGSGAGGSVGGGGAGGATFTFPVVINEIHATGEDWIELVNTGATPVDLESYGLSDSTSKGDPKPLDAARFPAGTTLGAGDRLLVVCEQDPAAGVGPHDVCLTVGGPSSCFYATWGISASKGEKLFLLAPDDSPVSEAEYPLNAVLDPSTWGRLPDGTGMFAENAPTPGETNKAP